MRLYGHISLNSLFFLNLPLTPSYLSFLLALIRWCQAHEAVLLLIPDWYWIMRLLALRFPSFFFIIWGTYLVIWLIRHVRPCHFERRQTISFRFLWFLAKFQLVLCFLLLLLACSLETCNVLDHVLVHCWLWLQRVKNDVILGINSLFSLLLP